MRKNKCKIIGVVIIFLFTLTSIPLVSKAKTITISYKDNNGIKCVNIEELAKAMKSEVKRDKDKITITINGKVISFKENDSFIAIDGQVIAMKTESKQIEGSKESFNLPIPQKIVKDGEGYLIPIDILEKYMGIKGTENGVIIEVKDENKPVGTNNTTTNRPNRVVRPQNNNNNDDDVDVEEAPGEGPITPDTPIEPETPVEPEIPDETPTPEEPSNPENGELPTE